MFGELPCELRFADARGADEEEVRDGLVRSPEPGTRAFHCLDDGLDGLILPEDFLFERAFKGGEFILFGG